MFLRTAYIIVSAMVATMKTSDVAYSLSVSSAPATRAKKLNSKLPTAILFDIDGTLVESDPIHYEVFRELLLKEDGFNDGKLIDEEFFRKWIAGRSNSLIMKDFFPQWSIENVKNGQFKKKQDFVKLHRNQ